MAHAGDFEYGIINKDFDTAKAELAQIVRSEPPHSTEIPERNMARITVDDCLKRITNRFHLTLAATYRARQLSAGASPMVEPNRDKPTVIALREIAAGKIGPEVLKKNPTPPVLYRDWGQTNMSLPGGSIWESMLI